MEVPYPTAASYREGSEGWGQPVQLSSLYNLRTEFLCPHPLQPFWEPSLLPLGYLINLSKSWKKKTALYLCMCFGFQFGFRGRVTVGRRYDREHAAEHPVSFLV